MSFSIKVYGVFFSTLIGSVLPFDIAVAGEEPSAEGAVEPEHSDSLTKATAIEPADANVAVEAPQSAVAPSRVEGKDAVQLGGVTVLGATSRGLSLDRPSETSSRLGLTPRETPATIDVLTQDQIQARGATSTVDALNTVPGVVSTINPGAPGTPTLRGFSAAGVSLLYDGARITAPSGFFTRIQDSWAFERVEVLKGPASILYGEGALAGAVNFVPKRAHFGPLESSGQLSYGSFDSIRVTGDANVPITDRFAARAVASYSTTDTYVDDTSNRFQAASLSFLWQPIDRLKIDVAADYSQDKFDPAYYGTPLVPRSVARDPSGYVSTSDDRVLDRSLRYTNFNYLDAKDNSHTLWLRSGQKFEFSSQWSFSNDFNYYISDRLFSSTDYTYNNTTALLTRNAGFFTHDIHYYIDRPVLHGDFTIAGFRNRVAIGAEYNYLDFFGYRYSGTGSPVAPYAPVRGTQPDIDNRAAFTTRNTVENKIDTTAEYFEDAFNITPRWLLVGGLRHDHIDVDRETVNANTGASTPTPTDFSRVTWRVGTVYDLFPKTQLFAQYATAATPPATLLTLTPAAAQFKLTTGNSVEGGIKSSFLDNRIDLSLTYFYIRQKDIVTLDPNNLNVSIQGGEQSSRGAEISLSALVTPQLRIDANYSAIEVRFDKLIEAGGADRQGNTPAGTPEQIGNLFAFYDLRFVPVTLSGSVHHSGRYFNNNANTIRVDDFTTFDAAVAYRFHFADVTLRGRNLGNAIYADGTGAQRNSSLILGPPRSVELSVSTKF